MTIFLCEVSMQFSNGFKTVDSIKPVLTKDSIEPIDGLQNRVDGLSFITPYIYENLHARNLKLVAASRANQPDRRHYHTTKVPASDVDESHAEARRVA